MDSPVVIVTLVVCGLMLLVFFSMVFRDVMRRRREEQLKRIKKQGKLNLRTIAEHASERQVNSVSGSMLRKVDGLIQDAGLAAEPAGVRVLILAVVVLVGGLVLVFRESLMEAAIAALVGGLLPLGVLTYRKTTRRRQMEEQLPDSLDLLARAVRAGESPDQAIALVAKETEGALGTEFSRCAKHLQMGLSMPLAMRALARRTRMNDLRLFATTLMVHRETGGNLAVTLERMAQVMRARLSYRQQFRSSTAGGRLAMLVIASMAIVALVYITYFQPEYLQRLLADSTGWIMLASAGLMQIIGFLWIMSLVRSDY